MLYFSVQHFVFFGHLDWQWVREEPDDWNLSAVPGKLRITAVTQSDIWKTSNTQTNLLGKTSPYEDFALTTEMAYGPLANYQSAGLLAYVDDNHYVKVERVYNSATMISKLRIRYIAN
ncbi:DUF1349 domain-containing protein [Paenibacillus agaridevorans]|uniref:beta-xylosidase family glycoside hydrolase n=1 Tax=Paenibacillus agaridevorans TaxID=171404 RepID=UPI002159E2A8|nr:DUF1349 domain-containing protein [Paenibacillus agaridevorans]